MNNHQDSISVAEAKSALKSLDQIESDTNASIRPPLWLNLIISALYGLMTFSWASTRHENLWMLGLICSTVGFLLAVAFYLYTSRLLGVKPKLSPKNMSELKFNLLLGGLFGGVFILTRVFSTNGFEWASYLGAAINFFVLAYSLHHYATGEFVKGKAQ